MARNDRSAQTGEGSRDPRYARDVFPVLDGFLGHLQAILGRSPLTVREYRYDLQMFFRYLKRQRDPSLSSLPFGETPIDDVDEAFLRAIALNDLYAFVTWLSRDRKASAATRARKVATLRSFFKYLKNKARVISEDPASELDTPKGIRRLPRHLSLDESRRLLSAADEGDEAYPERDYCILTLFLNCGLRLSELVGIDLARIRDERLTVLGKGAKERTVYLNGASLEALEAWLAARAKMPVRDRAALFVSRRGTRISTKMVQVIVKRYIRSAGLDPTRYSTHKLRHTAATLMYKYGKVDIRALQRILGHESIATTEIYTHVDDAQLQDAVEANPLAAERRGRKRSGVAPSGS